MCRFASADTIPAHQGPHQHDARSRRSSQVTDPQPSTTGRPESSQPSPDSFVSSPQPVTNKVANPMLDSCNRAHQCPSWQVHVSKAYADTSYCLVKRVRAALSRTTTCTMLPLLQDSSLWGPMPAVRCCTRLVSQLLTSSSPEASSKRSRMRYLGGTEDESGACRVPVQALNGQRAPHLSPRAQPPLQRTLDRQGLQSSMLPWLADTTQV